MLICIGIVVIALTGLSLYLRTPAVKGRLSEKAVVLRLGIIRLWDPGSMILSNLYIPKPSGETSEIDILYISTKGLIVIENKNYAGYVFGRESDKSWTVSLYAGKTLLGKNKLEKHRFYNPVWQNNAHVKWLKTYLGDDVKAFSVVTFSRRSRLKSIDVDRPDVFVCSHRRLSCVLGKIRKENPDVLSKDRIDEIYNKLKPMTNADKVLKRKHIEDINARNGGSHERY